MARVTTRVSYRDHGLNQLSAVLRRVGMSRVRVGVVGPKASELTADGRLTNVENAVIQQYGLGGGHGVARDFLDAPFRNNRAQVASILRRVMGRVVRLQESPEQAMDWAGSELQKICRDAIYSGVPPRNRPSTVAKKGFDHALIDSLSLYDAVSHQVVRESGGLLDAGSAMGDYETFEVGGG